MFLTIPLIFYLNKKNKAFWCGLGQLVAALANFLPLLAWLVVASTHVTTQITSTEDVELCRGPHLAGEGEDCQETDPTSVEPGKVFALGCFFVCKLCSGVAQQAYWTLGLAYMDDNVQLTSAPAVLGVCYMAGYLGGFLGKLLGSACLSVKVNSGDELGAWWLGWPVIGLVHCMVAACFLLLPHQISDQTEKAAEIQLSPSDGEATTDNAPVERKGSIIKEIWTDLTRLMKNKVLIFDSLAMSFWLFGSTNKSYTAKFVEFQFLTSPAAASLLSGSSSMVGTLAALMISVVLISWFKPSARLLAGFNFFADILAVVVGFSFILLDCDHSGVMSGDCEADCGCSSTYRPVCDLQTSQTFFSACSAGCQSIQNSTTFTDCQCSTSGSLVAGYCPTDCVTPLKAFLVTQFVLNFILGLGRVGNLLVHVRCVERKDKALGMAVQEISLALFAFIPGELMFGALVDSACTLWTDTGCGNTGNCLQYDLQDFRTKLFGASAASFGLAAVFDGLVWRGVKSLEIY